MNTNSRLAGELIRDLAINARQYDPSVGIFSNEELAIELERAATFVEAYDSNTVEKLVWIEREHYDALVAQTTWRPIEEAQKDGTPLLVLDEYGIYDIARWRKSSDLYGNTLKEAWRDEEGSIIYATHFLPLPLPPKGADDANV